MPTLTIKVNSDLCIGAASCVTVAPEFFRLNSENKAHVLNHGQNGNLYERIVQVTDDELDAIILAAQSCPTLAISIFDENQNQIFPV
ncbi:MAG: hypothetical protein ACD_76C00033G0004 [uncultured bacterium]|nr:MAG: hypothetical protein ACD_76C00033G0004 [uncultured bacterium]HBD04977.1 hypothetical protein [Candidatus Uhrbacteria bacterium]